jgi:hypothetical protein
VVFVLLLGILAMLIVIPVAVVAATRAVGRPYDAGRYERGPLDPALDDRLVRIEEAIDAMALQIEAMAQQQRLLLGPPEERARADDQPSPG